MKVADYKNRNVSRIADLMGGNIEGIFSKSTKNKLNLDNTLGSQRDSFSDPDHPDMIVRMRTTGADAGGKKMRKRRKTRKRRKMRKKRRKSRRKKKRKTKKRRMRGG